MNLNLTGQNTLRNQIAPQVQALKTAMDLRLTIWKKLPFEKRKAWITSGKDPIMSLAFDVYRYLRDNFATGVEDV